MIFGVAKAISREHNLINEAICRMIAEPLWCCKLSISARERVVELFTWDDVANQINEFYLELIESQNVELLHRSLRDSTQSIGLSTFN